MVPNEEVLVVETKIFQQVGTFHGLNFDVQRYLEILFEPGVLRYMDRATAETDPGFKQLIPYVIMICDGKCLSYVRGKRAGEQRLVGNRSIGIGGHINPVDDMSLFSDQLPMASYHQAVDREVAEEVTLQTDHTDRIVALLNDDSNEVGQVHLGIVHCWTLQAPKVDRREQMITQLEFVTPTELNAVKDTMETWSSLCLEQLDQIIASADCPENV